MISVGIAWISAAAGPDTKEKLSADDVITRHLDSIGTTEARSAIHSRLMALKCKTEGKTAEQPCPPMLISNDQKVLYYDNKSAFAFDGSKVTSRVPSSGEYSGMFPALEDALREGMVGGALSTGWALLRFSKENFEVTYDGVRTPLKSMGDVNCELPMDIDKAKATYHELSFRPRNKPWHTSVYLYFDPQTFRHVQTLYILPEVAPYVHSETPLAREVFGDFQTNDGITLPASWQLSLGSCGQGFVRLSQQGQAVRHAGNGWSHTVSFSVIQHNRPVDEKIFTVQ
jgi:hypothetical protein